MILEPEAIEWSQNYHIETYPYKKWKLHENTTLIVTFDVSKGSWSRIQILWSNLVTKKSLIMALDTYYTVG